MRESRLGKEIVEYQRGMKKRGTANAYVFARRRRCERG